MLLGLEITILPRKAIKALFCIPLFLLVCVTPGLSQKAKPGDGCMPKYDLHTETKSKGVVEEVNLLPLGTRKDFTELITCANGMPRSVLSRLFDRLCRPVESRCRITLVFTL